jgi:hypothetical protein
MCSKQALMKMPIMTQHLDASVSPVSLDLQNVVDRQYCPRVLV